MKHTKKIIVLTLCTFAYNNSEDSRQLNSRADISGRSNIVHRSNVIRSPVQAEARKRKSSDLTRHDTRSASSAPQIQSMAELITPRTQEISDLKNQLKMKSKEVSRINDEKIDFCDGLIKEKTNNLLLQSKVNRTERENKEKDKLIEKANKNLHELKKKNAEQANPGDINVEVGETTQIITAFNPTLKDATIGKDMKNSIAIINKIIKISETSKKKAKAEHECEHEKLMREASSIRLSFYKLDESNNTGGYQGTHNNIVELQDKVKDFSSSITVMSYLSSSQLKDLNKNSTNLQVICENMKSELERAKNTITESAVQIQQESDKSDVRNIITDREKKKSNPCCCTLF